jgi:hypothetical protein
MEETELGIAKIPIRATLDELDRDLQEAAKKVEGALTRVADRTKTDFLNLGKVVNVGIGAAATGIVSAVGAAGGALGALAIEALPLQGIADAFAGVSGNAEGMLAALREGSAGMVRDVDLMKSYNQAAQLVGKQFADRLPAAMQYTAKVAAATGQDQAFMIDSLVKGVGRLSPMILDNLGIQVQLSDATARAAQMFAVEEKALSKAQIQAGMMDVVLEKLRANTANMPDVTQSAAAGWARLQTSLKNTNDRVGMAMIPVLERLLPPLASLAERVLPVVIDKVSWLAERFGWLIDAVQDAGLVSTEVQKVLGSIIGDEAAARVMDFIRTIQNLATQIGAFVSEHAEELKGALIAIGAVLAAAGIAAAITGIAGAIASLASPVGIIIALAAMLGAAWAGNWGGIRIALTQWWEQTGRPIFEQVVAWLQVNIPVAIQAVSDFWTNTLQPALAAVWGFIQQNVIPILSEIVTWLATNVPIAIQAAADFWTGTLQPALTTIWGFISEKLVPVISDVVHWIGTRIGQAIKGASDAWNNVLLPAIQAVWGFIDQYLVPLFTALASVYIAILKKEVEILSGIWQNVLKPALEAAWGFISQTLGPVLQWLADQVIGHVQRSMEGWALIWQNVLKPALEALWSFVRDKIGPVLQWLKEKIVDALVRAFDSLKSAIGWVIDKLNSLKSGIEKLQLPGWLQPGSPTPFETGLRGIGKAMHDLARCELPQLQTQLSVPELAGDRAPGSAFDYAAMGSAVAAAMRDHPTYQLTANYRYQDERSLRDDLRLLQLLGAAT